jgi:hypothetical protein
MVTVVDTVDGDEFGIQFFCFFIEFSEQIRGGGIAGLSILSYPEDSLL